MFFLFGFRMVRGNGRIHSLGRCHIGGCAYFVWALPPKVVGTVQRTVADAVIETVAVYSIVWHLSRPRCAALSFVLKALLRRCRARPGAQQDCGRERGRRRRSGGDAREESTQTTACRVPIPPWRASAGRRIGQKGGGSKGSSEV